MLTVILQSGSVKIKGCLLCLWNCFIGVEKIIYDMKDKNVLFIKISVMDFYRSDKLFIIRINDKKWSDCQNSSFTFQVGHFLPVRWLGKGVPIILNSPYLVFVSKWTQHTGLLNNQSFLDWSNSHGFILISVLCQTISTLASALTMNRMWMTTCMAHLMLLAICKN